MKTQSDVSPVVKILPGPFGPAIVAARNIRWGEEIHRFSDCEVLGQQTDRTLQLSPHEHALSPRSLASSTTAATPIRSSTLPTGS